MCVSVTFKIKISRFIGTESLIPQYRYLFTMQAALGARWTVVLAEDGALHACGMNCAGQLGLNSCEHRLQPARVSGAELHGGAPVVLVAAGFRHWAAVLKEDGAVLTCGANGSGQLGHGDTQDRMHPARLCLPVFGGARASCSWPAATVTRWR